MRFLSLWMVLVCLTWLDLGVVAAQTGATLGLSGTRVTYDGDITVSAFTVSPAVRVYRPRFTLDATGAFSQIDGGAWSLQGRIAGSAFTPRFGGFQLEYGARADGSTHEDQSEAGQVAGNIRLHRHGPTRGIWLGGEVGRSWDGVDGRTLVSGQVGAWTTIGPGTFIATVTPAAIGESFRFTNLEAAGRVSVGSLELTAFGGLRAWGRPSDAETDGWGGASATWWLNNHLALVGAAGTYPPDFAQGFPGGRYATLSLRLATQRPTMRQTLARLYPRLAPPVARPVVPDFEVRHAAGEGQWTIRVRIADIQRLEIMGDFTDWVPVDLTRVDRDHWSVTLPIVSGTHRMNLRVDGGAWGVPPGVTVLKDEFGDAVGLLTVQ